MPAATINESAMPIPSVSENLAEASHFLALMGNAKRLEIMRLLSEGEKSVGELSKMTSMSQSATSQHLWKLRSGGLVKVRRQNQTILCRTDSDAVYMLLNTLDKLYADARRK